MRRAWVASFVLLAACARHPAPRQTVTPPPLLIDGRGTTMPLERAIRHVSFRPFIPSSQVLAFAVLPPLGGPDNDASRGLGVEYLAGHNAMLLSQWPRKNFAVTFVPGKLGAAPCTPKHYSSQAVGWTTRANLVMTLQADGPVAPGALDAEARRLVSAGACR